MDRPNMLITLIFFYFGPVFVFTQDNVIRMNVDNPELRCLVCKQSLDELMIQVEQIDRNIKVRAGGYSLDGAGNQNQKVIPLYKSEVKLTSLMEDFCKVMDDYVQAVWKKNGTLTLLKLMSGGFMNPNMGDVNIIQDDDLNKGLQYYCTEIIEEYREDIIKEIQLDNEDIKNAICTKVPRACPILPKNKVEL